MKKLIIIILLSFIYSMLYAQSNYDKQVQNQRLIMNDGLYDMIAKNKRNWNIQVPVSGGVQNISGSNGEAYTVSHSKGSNQLSRTKHVSPREVNARFNADREWRMEEARRKQEADRQRKRMEDDLSEIQARMQHAIATAPYYAEAAARDHWHATEGARILSEIKASDFVRLPKRKEISGAELAAGIKPKGSITIVSDKILKSDNSYNSESSVVDMAGGGVMDEQQVKSWMNSFEVQDLANIDMKNTKNKMEPRVLVKNTELPFDSLCLFTIPKYGLVTVWGDSMIVLKDKNLSAIAWKNNEQYSYVVPCGNKLIGKRDSILYVIGEEQSTKLLQLNTNEFSMFPHDDKSILLLSWDDGISTILIINTENNTYSEIVRLPCNIWTIVSNGQEIFALVENSIFAITKKGVPMKIYTAEYGINDIALSSSGLLIATDEQILYIKTKEEMAVFYEQGVKCLWVDDQGVYALDGSNDLLYFEN